MSDELVEAVAATIACNSPSGLQYPWHRAAALAIVAVVIERCAKVAEGPGFVQARDTEWDDGFNYAKRLIAAAIRKLGESE